MATYGLTVFKPNTSALDNSITAQRATWSTSYKNTVDSQVAADNAGALSSRAAVYSAFENITTSPGLPTETEIRYWMLTGVGKNNSTFKATYDSQYNNGVGTKTAAQVQAEIATRRYPNFNTLSPYPFYQGDNQITTPSLSTQDAYGNNKTILFLGISDNSIWTWDYATAVGVTYNTIYNWGLEPLNHPQGTYAAIIKYTPTYGSRAYIKYNNKWNNPSTITSTTYQKNFFPTYSNYTPNVSGYTYEVWVYPTLRNTKSTLFCMAGASGSQSNDLQPKFHIYINGSGYVVWDTLPFSTHTSTSTVPIGAWTLITCTYDGSTKRIYLNGNIAGSFSKPTPYNYIAMVGSLDRNLFYYGGPWTQYNTTITLASGSVSNFSPGDEVEFYGEGFTPGMGTTTRVDNTLYQNSSCIIQSISNTAGIIQLYGYINYFDGAVQSGIYIRKKVANTYSYSSSWSVQAFGDIADMGGDSTSLYRPLWIGISDSANNDPYTGLMGQIRITPDKFAYKGQNTISVASTWTQSGNQTNSTTNVELSGDSVVLTWSAGTYYVGFPSGNYTNFDWSNVYSLTSSSSAPTILGSAYFNGITSVCEIVPQNSTNWNFNSGTDFTVEFYLYTPFLPSSYVPQERCLLSYTNGSGGELWGVYLGPYPNFITIYNNSTALFEVPLYSGNTILYPINTLYHIALNCTGSTIKLFINGTQKAINSSFSGFGTYSSGGTLRVGGPAKIGGTPARSNSLFYNGYLSSLRVVVGKSIYTTNFNPLERKTLASRTKVLTAYAANKLAPLYPDELSIQYWMLTDIATGSPVPVFSTTDITWNQVYNGYLPKLTAFNKTFTNSIGRNIKVIQNLIDAPNLETSYTVGAPTINTSTGNVQIDQSDVDTYLTILMR